MPSFSVAQFNPQHFAALKEDVNNYAKLGYPYSDFYKPIMCLPEIAEAQAERETPIDRPG